VDRVALLYDDDCGLCRWILGIILRWDRAHRLHAVALSSAYVKKLLSNMTEDERMGSWHLLGPTGEVTSAGAAIAPLMRLLPFGVLFAIVVETFPRATAHAYDWVARHRHTIGARLGLQSCAIPARAIDDVRVG
jgi:predicted DCC family thiol-disulfide oxidoreductase YuxK